VEVVCDLHLRPYYGEEWNSVEELYESLAKDGTTTFHGYATLYARVRDKRYTLAVRRLTRGDTASSILAELLGTLEDLDLRVKAVYLDREFYDTYCLTLLQAHNYAYVMPLIRWGSEIQRQLNRGWSRTIDHVMQAETRRSRNDRRVSGLHRLYLPAREVRRRGSGASRLRR